MENDCDDMYKAEKSIYCDDGTNILINKFNLKDQKKLNSIEREIVTLKLGDYYEYMTIDVRNPNLLLDLHKFVFEDIYDFAGKFRQENIAKENFRFAEFKYVQDSYYDLMNEFKKDNYLVGLDKEKLSKKLAYYMAELNVLHPFRDGNGRIIREYIKLVAKNDAYELTWSKKDPKDIFEASVKSVHDDKDLTKCIYDCLEKID